MIAKLDVMPMDLLDDPGLGVGYMVKRDSVDR